MELKKVEAEGITKLISEWLIHDNHELECTFGKGTVDATTFFRVAQRLRSKGLRELEQEDRLTISTPQNVRFTIQGLGIIQQYCRDDTLVGKPYTVMIKDRNAVDYDNIDIADYEIRVKSRNETDIDKDEDEVKQLLSQWASVPKGFRLMRRWSFMDGVSGLRYDLSIVRSTVTDSKNPDIRKRSGFKWQRKFGDQNIASAPYMYEVEVELQRLMKEENVADAQKRFIKGIGEILRGIQKNSLLLRKSKKQKIKESYKKLVKTDLFLGCNSITLEQINFGEPVANKPNIRNSYNVTDKADGLRCLAYCDDEGELFLIDMGMNVYRTGLRSIKNRQSIVDGEWVTRFSTISGGKPANMFLAFDIYYDEEEIVSTLPFYNKEEDSRHTHLKKWIEVFTKDMTKILPYLTVDTMLQISMKDFYFGKESDASIFKYAAKVRSTGQLYNTDGLIFTPNVLPLPGYDEKNKLVMPGLKFSSQFKWKPAEDNTIDFLVRFEKDSENKLLDRVTIGTNPDTNETIRYKTMRLYVGGKKENPRDIILNERIVVQKSDKDDYIPVTFSPMLYPDPMASKCYRVIKTDNATNEDYVETEMGEPIQDYSIIEMKYDPSREDGWNWIPSRIRVDKTERLLKGTVGRTLNDEKTAESVWNSINDPITESMIRSGNIEPRLDETKKTMNKIEQRDNIALTYWNRSGQTKDIAFVRPLRNFHNLFIKEEILYKSSLLNGGKTIIDLGCGKGSDLERWDKNKVSFVLGIDYAGDNIMNKKDGIYARYLNNRMTTPMVFVIGDSSQRIIDGTAGSDQENKDILRSVFGRYNPIATVPSYVDNKLGGLLKNGADVMSCMFALHYSFQNEEKLKGILRNIREGLKLGGYFIGCCFDGNSVFDFLKDTPKGGSKTGVEGVSKLWNIRKDYDADELIPDENSLGLKINVEFISINADGGHDEYLVCFPYFIEKMKEIGCELLTDKQAAHIGLKHGTEMFGTSHKEVSSRYVMTKDTEKYSFLNRWFVFVKTRDITYEEEPSLKTLLNNATKPKTMAQARAEKQRSLVSSVSEPSARRTASIGENRGAEQFMNEEGVKDDKDDEDDKDDKDDEEEEEERAKVVGNAVNAVGEIREMGSVGAIERTLPVGLSSAVTQKTYTVNEIYKFYFNAPLVDTLKMGDKEASRYISPQTPFQIRDFDDLNIIYPSIEHFMAGMLFKYGTNKPELANTLFSRTGSIHQSLLNARLLVSKGSQELIPYDKDHELLEEEFTKIKAAIRPATIKGTYKAIFNETNFTIRKDELLRKAVEYRYKNDERMRNILEAARKGGKYILYYTEGTIRSNANLGGIRKLSGIIEGGNKLGKIYMDLAKISYN